MDKTINLKGSEKDLYSSILIFKYYLTFLWNQCRVKTWPSNVFLKTEREAKATE